MAKFISIPGTNHNGDRPRYVERPVKGPDGEVLYNRKVYEDGFDPGFDEGDGLHFNHAKLHKTGHEYSRGADRNSVEYAYKEPGSNRAHTVIADYERDNDGKVVLARWREAHE